MSYAQPADSGRRTIALGVVVLFHALLIYALVHGLAHKRVEVAPEVVEARIIEAAKPPSPDQPPPPQPRLAAPPPPTIPLPEVPVQLPSVAPQNTIAALTKTQPAAPVQPTARRAPARTVAAMVDAGNCDKPEYPPASLRDEESGVVRLAFLIDVDGRVLESKIERSTGYRRLDEAARRALAQCKFKPATVDGKPEKSWARIEYDWKIQ
ncbi:MAG TPA: TonB family protein [Rhodocyclaceae bacterium]|nr:TonB family protein [Rhodocyclaceae bacterium]